MSRESVEVTAGLGGFLAFFLLAVALYFLMRNMTARMRRMAYREEMEAKAAEEGGSSRARPDGSGSARPDGSGSGRPDGSGADRPDSSGPQSGPQDDPDVG